jgi:tRNA threonylcarbamoyladenosine biosynthesis protein TsaE
VEAGFREHFDEAAVCLIEWPERAGGQLPPADLGITLQFAGNGRDIAIEAHNERGRQCLSKLNL